MMEAVCSKSIDSHIIEKVRDKTRNNSAASFFRPRALALNYPSKETPKQSRAFVKNIKPLEVRLVSLLNIHEQRLTSCRKQYLALTRSTSCSSTCSGRSSSMIQGSESLLRKPLITLGFGSRGEMMGRRRKRSSGEKPRLRPRTGTIGSSGLYSTCDERIHLFLHLIHHVTMRSAKREAGTLSIERAAAGATMDPSATLPDHQQTVTSERRRL